VRLLVSLARWLNVEKAVFLASAAWLLVVGLRFQACPEMRQWAPPMTSVPPPQDRVVSLARPPALAGFLSGERANPFGERRLLLAQDRGDLARWPGPRRPGVTRPPNVTNPAPMPTPIPTPQPSPATGQGTAGASQETARAYDLPVKVIGQVQVGSSDTWVVFKVKEDGRTMRVREGMELPGLGVKLVRATRNVVVVENAEGQRFRLTDLMRGGGE
jgi:hypothetical protein